MDLTNKSKVFFSPWFILKNSAFLATQPLGEGYIRVLGNWRFNSYDPWGDPQVVHMEAR